MGFLGDELVRKLLEDGVFVVVVVVEVEPSVFAMRLSNEGSSNFLAVNFFTLSL